MNEILYFQLIFHVNATSMQNATMAIKERKFVYASWGLQAMESAAKVCFAHLRAILG